MACKTPSLSIPPGAGRRAICFFLLSITTGCAQLQVVRGGEEPSYAGALAQVDAQPRIEQAQIAYELGNLVEARRIFSELLEREPNNLDAALGLGETLLAAGETDAAAAQLSTVVERSAGRQQKARAQAGLGLVFLRRGDLAQAQSVLERSTAADPRAWRGWLALGQVYDRRKDFAQARGAYARAESSAPRESIVLNDIGVSLLAQGKPLEALAKFELALELDPGLETARQNIRLANASARRYPEAVGGAGEQELAAVLNNVGYVAILNGDLRTAESLLSQAIEASPFYNPTTVANLELLESARSVNAN